MTQQRRRRRRRQRAAAGVIEGARAAATRRPLAGCGPGMTRRIPPPHAGLVHGMMCPHLVGQMRGQGMFPHPAGLGAGMTRQMPHPLVDLGQGQGRGMRPPSAAPAPAKMLHRLAAPVLATILRQMPRLLGEGAGTEMRPLLAGQGQGQG